MKSRKRKTAPAKKIWAATAKQNSSWAHAAAERDHETGDAVGDAVVVDPDDPNFAGRAELRAAPQAPRVIK